MTNTRSRVSVCVAIAATFLFIAGGTAARTEQGPEELRGQVSSIAGDKITIKLSQAEWLPKPAIGGEGIDVKLGQEISGIFVPLMGMFAIVQVNADSCVAQPVGAEAHGEAAVGMLAVIATAYPHRPQRVADYRSPPNPAIVQAAEAGMPDMQNSLAMTAASKGDYDGALNWWERAQAGATDRFVAAAAALGRARILETRHQYDAALAALQDAVTRTAPRADELTFASYSQSDYTRTGSAVEWHVDLLGEIASVYRGPLRNTDEARRWYAAAAEIMEAAATRGVPNAGDPSHEWYLDLLVDLGELHLRYMEDEETAVPWLLAAARAGSERAQSMLRELGRSW
jgi:tetratricopeptide (TPR) repeat protein